MHLRVGTLFTGTVDRVGGEFIQTKFFAIVVPLIPLGSFFVLKNHGRGFPIPLSVKSVFWAYVRWFAFLGVVVATAESFMNGWSGWVCVMMTALWVLATFFTIAPNQNTLAKRSVFKAATGVSALPSMLPIDIAQGMLASLEKNPMQSNPAWAYVVASLKARLARDEAQSRLSAEAERAWSNMGLQPTSPALR